MPAMLQLLGLGLLAGLEWAACPARIWCLGDSITGGPSPGGGCWRAYLQQSLQKDGYTKWDFVGSLTHTNCEFTYDGDNDGHWGYLATDIASGNYQRAEEGTLEEWLSKANPDVMIMHLGTNDVWHNVGAAQVISAFDVILEKVRGKSPNVKVVVAQIIDLAPHPEFGSCGECGQRVTTLNGQIVGWAQKVGTAASPVTVADCHTGFDAGADTVDGVHPTNAGYQKMAAAFLKPVEAYLDALAC